VANAADIQRNIALFEQLNAGYLASDQRGDVKRYEELPAESLPDLRLRDKRELMEMMSRPKPFNGIERQGRNTDGWQR
jgi:hypothetical protein